MTQAPIRSQAGRHIGLHDSHKVEVYLTAPNKWALKIDDQIVSSEISTKRAALEVVSWAAAQAASQVDPNEAAWIEAVDGMRALGYEVTPLEDGSWVIQSLSSYGIVRMAEGVWQAQLITNAHGDMFPESFEDPGALTSAMREHAAKHHTPPG